jgi:hypothetical protein
MKCEKYLQMIDDLVEGDLNGQTASYINSHISQCPECKHHYVTLKREREMYEHYFENEPSAQLWTQFQTKLKVAQANNTSKSAKTFARVVDWKLNIFEHSRLTPAVACAGLLLLFGIGFGLSKFLSSKEISENALVIERESKSPRTTGAKSVEIIQMESNISQEMHSAPKDNSLQIKQKNSESEISGYRILDTKSKKSFVREANTAKQGISAKRKEFSPVSNRSGEKERMSQLQAGNSEGEQDFYSLPFAGVFDESKEELQILRVELPRSSLIALGVNLPTESGEASIKTDLLVSSDGVARAVRLLK